MARTPGTGMDRRTFLGLVLTGAGALATGRPRWASADTIGLDGTPAGVAIAGGRAVAVGTDERGDASAWWSTDGRRWSRTAFPASSAGAILGDVTADPSGFIAVGSVDRRPTAWWSADGTRWDHLASLRAPGHLVAVAAAGSTVLAGGARQEGEADEGTGALLATLDGGGGGDLLSTTGIGDLAHGSITAVARHGDHWVVGGAATGSSGLWRSASRGWAHSPVPGREPVLWSSLLPVSGSLVAVGATIAGGVAQMARSTDGRAWAADAVPDALAALGIDLRGATVDHRTGSILLAGATGAVSRLADGALG